MMTAAFLATIRDFFRISFHSAKRLSRDPGPLEKPRLSFHVKRFGITHILLCIALRLISPCDGIIDLDISTMSSRTEMPISALEKSSTTGATLPIEYLSFRKMLGLEWSAFFSLTIRFRKCKSMIDYDSIEQPHQKQ